MATHPLHGMKPAEEADAEKVAETDIVLVGDDGNDLGGNFNCRR